MAWTSCLRTYSDMYNKKRKHYETALRGHIPTEQEIYVRPSPRQGVKNETTTTTT